MFNGYHIYVPHLGFLAGAAIDGGYTRDISTAWFCTKLQKAEIIATHLRNFFTNMLEIDANVKIVQITLHGANS